jgi:hypothetical protein
MPPTRDGIGCGKVSSTTLCEGNVIRHIATIGIDLAKAVFQLRGVDAHGHAVLTKQIKHARVACGEYPMAYPLRCI